MKKLLIPSVAKAAAKDPAPFCMPHHSGHTPPLTFPLQAHVCFCKHTAFLSNRCLFLPFQLLWKTCVHFLYVHFLLLYPNSVQHVSLSSVTWGIVSFSFTLAFGFLYFCRLQPGNWKMGHRKPGLLHLSQFVIAALVLFF